MADRVKPDDSLTSARTDARVERVKARVKARVERMAKSDANALALAARVVATKTTRSNLLSPTNTGAGGFRTTRAAIASALASGLQSYQSPW
jgi:hypothetical protein